MKWKMNGGDNIFIIDLHKMSKNLLKEKNVRIQWFMGHCYVYSNKTDKMIVEKSFDNYESALFAIKFLPNDKT